MHCATGRGRLQSWANKNKEFASLCTRLVALPDGMGALYNKLVSCRYGPKYINNEEFREQLASCHARNRELTAALIANEEGALVVLNTSNGMLGSTFENLETDIDRRSPSVKYSYMTALASHESNRAATQIKAVEEAGDEEAEQTFPNVRRQAARSKEAGTFCCGFDGCTKRFADLRGLRKHVTQKQTAKPPTHVGYTPDKDDFEAEIKARGNNTHARGKKTWPDSPP